MKKVSKQKKMNELRIKMNKSKKGKRQEKGRNEEGRRDRNKGSEIETDEGNWVGRNRLEEDRGI